MSVAESNPDDRYDFYIWYDGSCGPTNPGGTAAWGLVFKDSSMNLICKKNGIVGKGKLMSNNVAEFAAANEALHLILANVNKGQSVLMQGDSLLSVNILSGKWKVRYNKKGMYLPYYKIAAETLSKCHDKGLFLDIRWVGREENQEADDLSKRKW